MANIGDRVLICDGYWESKVLNGTFNPQYGVVENKHRSEDRSYHGSPMYDIITVVRGDDGKIYTDDSDMNFTRDWKKTPKFFSEQEFAGAIQGVIQRKEQEIAAANCDIRNLKKLSESLEVPKAKQSLDGQIQSASVKTAPSNAYSTPVKAASAER